MTKSGIIKWTHLFKLSDSTENDNKISTIHGSLSYPPVSIQLFDGSPGPGLRRCQALTLPKLAVNFSHPTLSRPLLTSTWVLPFMEGTGNGVGRDRLVFTTLETRLNQRVLLGFVSWDKWFSKSAPNTRFVDPNGTKKRQILYCEDMTDIRQQLRRQVMISLEKYRENWWVEMAEAASTGSSPSPSYSKRVKHTTTSQW